MAERQIQARQQFTGLSSDTKTTENVGFGAEWYEEDTGDVYRLSAAGAWVWNRNEGGVGLPLTSARKISPVGGSKTVAATGTAEALAATARCTSLYVRAKTGNTQNVYLGSSTVDKTTSQQIILAAGQSVSIDAPAGYSLDVSEFFVDADVNSEGVDFLYV